MGRTECRFRSLALQCRIDVDLKDPKRYAVYLCQAGLGLPDRDYYLQADFAEQKAAYQAYVAKLLTLIGWPDADGAAPKPSSPFETRIAEASWTKVAGARPRRDLQSR